MHARLLLLLALLPASAFAGPPSPFAAVAERARPGIVTVTGYDKGEVLLRSRPGFFLGDAHVVTVRHPLLGAQRVDVTLADGAVFPVTGVEAEDATVDLVLLKIAVPSDPLHLGARDGARRALRWAAKRPAAGDLVIVVSDADGAAGVAAGTLSAYKELPGLGALLALDVDLAGGWEGSPVLDYDGQVLGVASVGYDGAQKKTVAFLATRLAVLKADEPLSVPRWSNQAQAAITKSGPDLYAFGRAAVAAGNLEVALSRLEQAVMKAPGHSDAWVTLGVVKARLERWGEAIECFERTVRLSRDHAEGQTNLCLALAHLERWTTARIRCDEARRLAPDDPRVIFQQAHVLDALGSWEGALAGYDRVLELQPGSLEAHYARGVVLAGRGRYPEAIASFQALCRLDASHRDTLRRLGDAFQGANKHHEATEAYQKAIEVRGPDAQVYARLGQSWLALNQAGKALAAFEQAVRLQPSEVKTFFALGQAFTHLQRPDQAATMFRQAVRLNERYAAAWFELGEVLRGQARHAEAEEAYERCLEVDDRHVGARYGLGLTHVTRGDRDAAWEQVRRLQPLDASRSRALADLIIQ